MRSIDNPKTGDLEKEIYALYDRYLKIEFLEQKKINQRDESKYFFEFYNWFYSKIILLFQTAHPDFSSLFDQLFSPTPNLKIPLKENLSLHESIISELFQHEFVDLSNFA